MLIANALVLVVCGAILGGYASVSRDRDKIAAFSRREGLSLVLGFSVIATLFISGYVFEDPGGPEAWLRTAAWVGPMVGLSLWAWWGPRSSEPALWLLLGGVVLVSGWWALSPQAWQDVMDEHGPVVGIAALAVGVGLAVWGYHRPLRGAAGLAVVATAPVVGAGIADGFGFATAATSTAVTVSPFLTCALLYLLSWYLGRIETDR